MKFSVPFNGDKNFLSKLVQSGLSENVAEIYFAGNPLIMGSGRRPKIKSFIVKNGSEYIFNHVEYDDEIKCLIQEANSIGIKSNLLMNFNGSLTGDMVSYVSNLLEFGLYSVTVGNWELLKQVKKVWPENLEIQNSVYMNVNSYSDIEELVNMGVSVFLLPPELNDEFSKIAIVHKIISQYESIKLKIMVNEGCIKYCPHRKYDQLDSQNYKIESAIQDFINDTENKRVLSQPCRAYMNTKGIGKTNFINPKDINKYQQFDPILKIVGRSYGTEKIFQTIRAYLSATYEGDLRDIIENFKHSQSIIHVDSEAKTDFLLSNEGA